jgi:hypothetical protein
VVVGGGGGVVVELEGIEPDDGVDLDRAAKRLT